MVDEEEAEEVAEAEDAELAEAKVEEGVVAKDDEGEEWDFDLGEEAEESTQEPKPATPTVEPPTPVKLSPSTIFPSPPVVPIALLTAAPTSPVQPPISRHAKKESLGGWGWEGDDEVPSPPDEDLPLHWPKVVDVPPSPPQVVSLSPSPPRSAAPPTERTPRVRKWKETMLISAGSRSIVATAEEVLREALEVGSPA